MVEKNKRVVIELKNKDKFFGIFKGIDEEITINPKIILKDDKGNIQYFPDSEILRLEVLN